MSEHTCAKVGSSADDDGKCSTCTTCSGQRVTREVRPVPGPSYNVTQCRRCDGVNGELMVRKT